MTNYTIEQKEKATGMYAALKSKTEIYYKMASIYKQLPKDDKDYTAQSLIGKEIRKQTLTAKLFE